MILSVIIPVLNEETLVVTSLQDLKKVNGEVILVDGGSTDRTVPLLRDAGFGRMLSAPRGRASQINLGSSHAKGDVFLFLHLDCRLPDGAAEEIEKALEVPGVVGGAFPLGFHPSSLALKVIAFMANLRSRLTRVPYGDQAIFVRRSAFTKLGGFSNLPILEDVDFCRRLKRLGRLVILKDKVLASPRRWQKGGLVRTTLRNWRLLILYHLGFSPERLARFYPSVR